MKSNMWKSTFREIKQSFGRFMAIFAITALGVSLFSGLKILQPAMVKTTDEYFKEKNLYDYRLMSTLGYEEENVAFLREQEDVRYAEGIFSFDVLCQLEGESAKVIKTYNLPEQINQIELLYGRMPESAEECIVDALLYGEDSIGKTVYLSEDNTEEDLEHFAVREFTITGIAKSSGYIQYERGNSSLGNGRISGFMYLPKEAFDADYYTEILVKFNQDPDIYSDDYDAYMEEKEPIWEELAQTAADSRYEKIRSEAEETLADAKEEFAEKKLEGQQDLVDAKAKLDEAFAELQKAERELADGKQELTDGRTALEENRKTLNDAQSELGRNEKALESAEADLNAGYGKLGEQSAALEQGKAQLETAEAEVKQQKAAVDAAKTQMESLESGMTALETQLIQLEYGVGTGMLPEEQQLAAIRGIEGALEQILQQLQTETIFKNAETLGMLDRIAQAKTGIQMIRSEVEQQKTALSEAETELQNAEMELAAQKLVIQAGESQISNASSQIAAGKQEIVDGKEQLQDGKEQLQKGLTEFSKGEEDLLSGESQLAEAEADLEAGWKEYYDGLEEYEEGCQEFETQIAEAEAEILDAEKEIEEIEQPEVYVLGRETNVGYVCMENDSSIVDGIANVFPVFFYAVAALVCITTMSRMVEEQRTQIGVLKALGYSEASIMGKYLFYSGFAAITGCLFGYFLGIKLFPIIIWYAYSSMYTVKEISYLFDAGILIFSLVISMLCSMGVTFVCCKNELSEVAAELMRPKAPKAGKRVLLERISWIWKRMKFLHKVSYRNVFRYKKRFFMMVIGISGCTALLVTGFGVKDSVATIATEQFDRIQVYDINIMLTDNASEKTDQMLERIGQGRIQESVYVMEKTMDLVTEESVKSISLVAVDENAEMSSYVKLPDPKSGENLSYPETGQCILTDKIAETYGLQVGDTVTLRDEENHTMELTLSGIAENYLYNYVYMTIQTYETCLGEPAQIKSIYLNTADGADPHQIAADLMKEEQVTSASVSADSKDRSAAMIESLDLLVVVIIICAGFLAFIVLYNLTNINITERIREIATIKVLGFFKNETASYVFRENLILTMIGALAGLGLGKIFHAFVMSQVQVDQVSFKVQILTKSYLYSFLLTFVFAVIVNLFMSKKLDRVSMTESLKSVD